MEQLVALLDHLAHLVAAATQDDVRRCALEAVVADLERAAGADLGPTADPVVVLGRRFSRVHRLLLRCGVAPAELLSRIQHHVSTLAAPAAAEGRDVRMDARPSAENRTAAFARAGL